MDETLESVLARYRPLLSRFWYELLTDPPDENHKMQVPLVLLAAVQMGFEKEFGELLTAAFAVRAIRTRGSNLWESVDPIPPIEENPSRDSMVIEGIRRFSPRGFLGRKPSEAYLHHQLFEMSNRWIKMGGAKLLSGEVVRAG